MSGKLIHGHLWGSADRAPFDSARAEVAQRADRGGTRERFLPSFGPHGCVKPYCCLFVYIESLLRSDGRYQTERGSVSGVSNEPNPFYVALGPPFILSRGHRQVAT